MNTFEGDMTGCDPWKGMNMTNSRFCFRAYLESEKRMTYSQDWDALSWAIVREWARNGHLMQATGLSDVNGNAIYENDIVDVYNTYKEESFRGSVHFQNGTFFIRKNDLTSHNRFINYEIRVIGNLYENPKLLNQG